MNQLQITAVWMIFLLTGASVSNAQEVEGDVPREPAPMWPEDQPVPALNEKYQPSDPAVVGDDASPAGVEILSNEDLSWVEGLSEPQTNDLTHLRYLNVSTAPIPVMDNTVQLSRSSASNATEAADGLVPLNLCRSSRFTDMTARVRRSPQNTVVRLEIQWFRRFRVPGKPVKRQLGPARLCTATALSNIVLVTAAHCVEVPPDPSYPRRIVKAHYGYDGTTATLGTRVSRCVSWYKSTQQTDNAIIVLKHPMNLKSYRDYDYVSRLSPLTGGVPVYMFGFAGGNEQTCVKNRYGILFARATSDDLRMRTGNSIGRCGGIAEVWASVSQVKGQSGACLIHGPTGVCMATASHDCEGNDCSRVCPNAWGGFTATYSLKTLWQRCGVGHL